MTEKSDSHIGRVYHVDAVASLVYVRVYKDRAPALARLAHDHVIRAPLMHGEVVFDQAGSANVDITFDAVQLSVDEPWLRQRLGLTKPISPSDRHKTAVNMRGATQLDTAHHPNISVRGCCHGPIENAGVASFVGTIAVRGTHASLETSVDYRVDASELSARGQFTLRHSDFGMQPYKALLAAIRNRDALRFVFDIRATP